jgi:hypothetical protein
MSKFDDYLSAVRDGAKELAKELFSELGENAKKDTQAFLESAKEDLERWTKLVAEGKLVKQDLSDLVEAKKALLEMRALREAGVFAATLERFRSGVLALVVDKAFSIFV